MVLRATTFLFIALLCVPFEAMTNKVLKRFAVGLFTSASLTLTSPCPNYVFAAEGDVVVEASLAENKVTFDKFLALLDDGKVSDVVFSGIRPTYVTITYEEGDNKVSKRAEVRDGFPFYDDPLTPSGPTQVLAKVKSTPNVKWSYDLSELMQAREGKNPGWSKKKH